MAEQFGSTIGGLYCTLCVSIFYVLKIKTNKNVMIDCLHVLYNVNTHEMKNTFVLLAWNKTVYYKSLHWLHMFGTRGHNVLTFVF